MIKEIQGLRAIAILMVLFVHILAILPPSYYENIINIQKLFFTSTGVEIFFVLAGYFLMHSLDKMESTVKKPQELILDFIINKFKRLAPIVYFWSFIALLFAIFTNNQNSSLWLLPITAIKKFLSTLLFLRNFTEVSEASWLGIYWAVSLEFQTFIIVSIIYFVFGKKIVLYLSTFFILLMMVYRFGGNASWLFRFDPILLGILTYQMVQSIGREKLHKYFDYDKKYKFIISGFTILLLGSTLKVFPDYLNFNITISAFVAGFMVILALSNNGCFYINARYINSIIDWLGSRSYSLYCTHIISWVMIRQGYIFLNQPLDNKALLLGRDDFVH